MYQSYWELTGNPFTYRVAFDQLYPSRTLQSASLRLRYCFDNNAGAALLLGVSGVGKSSLLQQLRHDEARLHPFAHIVFPNFGVVELNRVVASELLEESVPDHECLDTLLHRIQVGLLRSSEAGQHGVIAFDEAHLLSNEALNQVILPLLNLADTDQRLSFSVILCGQPSLASQVARNAQLRDRIAVTATVEGFTPQETLDYIDNQLHRAGAVRRIFTDDAIQAVYELSGGNPRRINRLCNMALLVGCGDKLSEITSAEIDSLASELLPAAA